MHSGSSETTGSDGSAVGTAVGRLGTPVGSAGRDGSAGGDGSPVRAGAAAVAGTGARVVPAAVPAPVPAPDPVLPPVRAAGWAPDPLPVPVPVPAVPPPDPFPAVGAALAGRTASWLAVVSPAPIAGPGEAGPV
jgi:hypothetical protein